MDEQKTNLSLPFAAVGDGAERCERTAQFLGFEPLSSNWVYCPNQFFDTCLPYRSRGCVRLVGYMIRRTLGWRDQHGDPIDQPHILTSYNELIRDAGISRGAIRDALDEAIKWGFIRCVNPGRRSVQDETQLNGVYELRWDEESRTYETDPKQFRGFVVQGCRTDIPNQFFDVVIPNEPLAVIKVVGVVIRQSIGFEARFGSRRKEAQLSYTDIQRRSKIGSRDTLNEAIRQAIHANFIQLASLGYFDPNAGRASLAAKYALKWLSNNTYHPTGSKTVPGKIPDLKPTNRFKNRTETGSKTVPANRFKNRTGIETKQRNETLKQQQAVVASVNLEAAKKLAEAGFDLKTAQVLALGHSLADVEQQIAWLPLRNPSSNPLGLLRRAIENSWPAPLKVQHAELSQDHPGREFVRHFYAGKAGNEGQPTAEPTPTEIAIADAFVKLLLAEWAEPSRVPDWGRQFGAFVRRTQESEPRKVRTFPLAVRLFGDTYAAHHRGEKRNFLQRVYQTNRSEVEARMKPAWYGYVAGVETRVAVEQRADYERFEAWRLERRGELANFRPGSSVALAALAHHDSERKRLDDFRAFFPDATLDFWPWVKTQNTNIQTA
ncbi:MAG TPA: hypothetical protein PLD59_05120 [Tepidisphaeraceae bacterium]|nr:hypothetical protein [Tepidisphaeraceae bacterium]